MNSPFDYVILAAIVAVVVVGIFRGVLERARQRRKSLTLTHAVFIKLPLSDNSFGTPEERDRIRQLEDRLREAIDRDQAGEYDGDEFGEGCCTLYMYGPDADRLFQAIQPVLQSSALPSPSQAIKRYGGPGDPGVREEHITL